MSLPAVLGPNFSSLPFALIEIEDGPEEEQSHSAHEEKTPPCAPVAVPSHPPVANTAKGADSLPQTIPFPPIPQNVMELIVSFTDAPERLNSVCKKFKTEIIPHSIALQLERLKEHSEAVDALSLAEIDISQYKEEDFSAAPKSIYANLVARLDRFFFLTSPMPRSQIFQLLAEPEKLASAIYAAYLSSIIEVLFAISSRNPLFSEAGEFASRLLDEEPAVGVKRAFQWAKDVSDLCKAEVIIPFSVSLTNYKPLESETVFLPFEFLKCLSLSLSIKEFGVFQIPLPPRFENEEIEGGIESLAPLG